MGFETIPIEDQFTAIEFTKAAWIFRGLEDSLYCLEPSIEREARSSEWSELEKLAAFEFKSRAHMHFDPGLIPKEELTWLAQMQHYGIPTRLLDFTYSPFVALYFAVRKPKADNGKENRTHVRLWAINEKAVNDRFQAVASDAWQKDLELKGEKSWGAFNRLSFFNPDSFATNADIVTREINEFRDLIARSLAATGTYRGELKRQGCAGVAQPPTYNPRLASQQGVFLINFAEELTLCESLNKMMEDRKDWCRRFDISIDAIADVETKLFQMNIHEQSLFPDIQGLGGFIRQKLRLHWQETER